MTDDAIAAFWRWWPEVATAVAAQVDDGPDDDLVRAIAARVDAIDAQLAWEISEGIEARLALVVTPEGNAEARAAAERWRRAAPPPDTTWEYHAARLPVPSRLDSVLQLGTVELDLSETLVVLEIDEGRQLVDVVVHHPGFPHADERARTTATFLVLDWLLGEDDVERYVGGVDIAVEPPEGAVPIADALQDAVAQLRSHEGEPRGVLLEGRDGDGLPVLVSAQRPLRPVDHPLLDTNVSVVLEFEGRSDGLPEQDALNHLRALEDQLMAELGDDCVLAAHVTHGGERELLIYVDGTGPDAHRARAWQRRNADEGAIDVRVQHDPAWDAVAAFR